VNGSAPARPFSLRLPEQKRGTAPSPHGGRCELCRKRAELLTKTPCCGRMVCIVSFSKRCCAVKHGRFTLCGAHNTEGHVGDWKICEVCPRTWPLEMYVWYGTNKWNFEKLENL
jgi:hypothetical protein